MRLCNYMILYNVYDPYDDVNTSKYSFILYKGRYYSLYVDHNRLNIHIIDDGFLSWLGNPVYRDELDIVARGRTRKKNIRAHAQSIETYPSVKTSRLKSSLM